MPPLPERARVPLARRFQTALATTVANATPAMHRAWNGLDNYDEDSVDALTAAVQRPLAAVKTTTVRQSTGFYAVLAGVAPPMVRATEIAVVAAMRDPFIATWRALASGNNYTDAVAAGRARLEAVLTNFTVSTSRHTGAAVLERTNRRVVGWERITNAGACPWCEEVSGQLYNSADSADFGHDRCQCSAVPLIEA